MINPALSTMDVAVLPSSPAMANEFFPYCRRIAHRRIGFFFSFTLPTGAISIIIVASRNFLSDGRPAVAGGSTRCITDKIPLPPPLVVFAIDVKFFISVGINPMLKNKA